jgi:hypothetical protein
MTPGGLISATFLKEQAMGYQMNVRPASALAEELAFIQGDFPEFTLPSSLSAITERT